MHAYNIKKSNKKLNNYNDQSARPINFVKSKQCLLTTNDLKNLKCEKMKRKI